MKRSIKLLAASTVAVVCMSSPAFADEQYVPEVAFETAQTDALVGSLGAEYDRVDWREDYQEDRCSYIPCGNVFVWNWR